MHNIVSNDRNSIYQENPYGSLAYYAVILAVDPMPFIAAITATAILPRGTKFRFELTEENPARDDIFGWHLKSILDRAFERLLKILLP